MAKATAKKPTKYKKVTLLVPDFVIHRVGSSKGFIDQRIALTEDSLMAAMDNSSEYHSDYFLDVNDCKVLSISDNPTPKETPEPNTKI